MRQGTTNRDSSPRIESKGLNVIVWVVIALVVALMGAWTLWASHQAGVPSIWAPE